MSLLNAGVCSEGLRTAAFPAAMALTYTRCVSPQVRWKQDVNELTKGEMSKNVGKLKGAMIRTAPLGSATILGRIAKKLKSKSADCAFTHFSTLLYATLTSAYTGPRSNLPRPATKRKKRGSWCHECELTRKGRVKEGGGWDCVPMQYVRHAWFLGAQAYKKPGRPAH